MLNKRDFRGAPVATLCFFGAMVRRSLQVPPVLWHPVAPVQRKPLQHKAPLRFHRLFSWEKFWARERGNVCTVYRWCMICYETLLTYIYHQNECCYLQLFTSIYLKRTYCIRIYPECFTYLVELFGVLRIPTRTWQAIFRFTHFHFLRCKPDLKVKTSPPKKVLPNEMQL